MTAKAWTTSNDLRDQLLRLWDRGQILAARMTGEPLFPLSLRLRRPSPRELGERFHCVRAWIRALEDSSKPRVGFGYEIAWEEVNHRQLGRNRVPLGITVPTRSDALSLIGKAAEAEQFDVLARRIIEANPSLAGWLARKPLTVLDHTHDWERVLGVIGWFKDHPRSGRYARQIDVQGVDTKFIEARKGLLSELLDVVLPPGAIEQAATGVKGFEARYGLRTKPILVRFRILDDSHAIADLTDLTVPIAQFAKLAPAVRRVFVTENEVNGLVFPEIESGLVVFGLGYALELLASVPWLREREIHYWGDIDTHGFAMLDRLRSDFPRAGSLLMDAETLAGHRQHWSIDESPYVGGLTRLTKSEMAVYDDLRFDRLGQRVRLEQERISFACLERALRGLKETSTGLAGYQGQTHWQAGL